MSQTTWSGPLASGDRNAGESGGPNIGLAYLSQTALINFDATLVQNATFNIPASSQIVDFYVDVLTAYDSATSATLSAGPIRVPCTVLRASDPDQSNDWREGASAPFLFA